MRTSLGTGEHRQVLKVVGIYAIFSLLWIFLSDSALELFVKDPATIARISVFKGFFFVLVTAALLFHLISRYVISILEAKERLRLSEEKFATAFRISPDSVNINRQEDGTYLEVNEGFTAITGYQPEEVIGRSSLDLNIWVNPEDRGRLVREIDAQGIAINHEAEFRKKDGTIVVGQMSARRIDIEGVPCILNITRDITERKQTEELLRESERALKLLIEAMPVGVGVADDHGVVEYLNSSFVNRFGYTIDDIPTVDVWFHKAYPDPAYRDQVAYDWKNGLANMAKGAPASPQEVEITCKNGNVRHVIINAQLIHHRVLAIFTDITEREFLQNELLKVQKLESLGLLAGGIAHDFKNILTSILGNISFAQVFMDKAHKAHHPLEQAEKATHRAAELAGQLLTFAKGGDPVKKPVSVQRLVDESISLVLRGTNVAASVDIPDGLHTIEADAGQINQTFNNIIINAVQAMPDGGRLTVKAENATLDGTNTLGLTPGKYVKLSFSDEGCGIPDKEQKQIFDPYFTTKSGGTGLGLSSAYSIITRHGGHIAVNSGVGCGSTFTIHLPAIDEEPAEPGTGPGSVATANPAGGFVLVMDDDEMILELAEKMLHLLGYRVTTCTSGEEAISKYKSARESGTPFDAVIMDLTVPGGMGGRETAEKILAFDPGARLIVSSGYSNDPIIARFGEYGFCGAMVKPYRINELVEVLSRVTG